MYVPLENAYQNYSFIFGEADHTYYATYRWKVGMFYFWVRYLPGQEILLKRWTRSTQYSDKIELEDVLLKLESDLQNRIVFNLDLFR